MLNLFGRRKSNEQIVNPKASAFSLRIDASTSVRRCGLEEAMVEAVEGIERTVGRVKDNRLSRSTFNSILTDLDTAQRGGRGKEQRFIDPNDPGFVPFRKLYARTIYPGTYLDEVLEKDSERLLRRHSSAPERRHYAFLLTDGIMTPGSSVSGPIRDREARRNIQRIMEIALSNGGITNASIAFLYVGIGGTLHDHHEMACGRYGLPREWVLWRDATAYGVREAGAAIEQSISDISASLKTGFNFDDDDDQDDDDRPDYLRTHFDFD